MSFIPQNGVKHIIEKKKFHTIEEPQRLQRFAAKCSCDVGLHSLDDSIIVDTKSYIGIYALNFKEPTLVANESKELFDMIEGVGEALE